MKISEQINKNQGDVLNADTIHQSSGKSLEQIQSQLQDIIECLRNTDLPSDIKLEASAFIEQATQLTNEQVLPAQEITDRLNTVHSIIDSVVGGTALAKKVTEAISLIGQTFL